MRRVKEDEIKEILEVFNQKTLMLQIKGIFIQECFFENAEIIFFENNIEFQIKSNNKYIILNLSYIEEIYLLEKNKLKFLTNEELEILICVI